MRKVFEAGLLALSLAGCAMATDVMDAGNGTYMISARASAVRGGEAGARQVAYKDAQSFCIARNAHAVVLDAQGRDVYQTSFGGSVGPSGGDFGGGTFAAGNVDLRFRCAQ